MQMEPVDFNEYFQNHPMKKFNDRINQVMEELMISENTALRKKRGDHTGDKPVGIFRLPYSNFEFIDIKGLSIVQAMGSVFVDVISSILPQAKKVAPERFPVDTPDELIEILLSIENSILTNQGPATYEYFLRTENFCLMLPEDLSDKRMLRLDLYRLISRGKDAPEFTGGLFHVLDHFKINDFNYMGNSNQEVSNLYELIKLITEALFQGELTPGKSTDTYQSIVSSCGKQVRFVFFRKVVAGTNLYFLKSCFRV